MKIMILSQVLATTGLDVRAVILGVKLCILIVVGIVWLEDFIKLKIRLKEMSDDELMDHAMLRENHKDLKAVLTALIRRGANIDFVRPVLVGFIRAGGQPKASALACLKKFYPEVFMKAGYRTFFFRYKIHKVGWSVLEQFARS